MFNVWSSCDGCEKLMCEGSLSVYIALHFYGESGYKSYKTVIFYF